MKSRALVPRTWRALGQPTSTASRRGSRYGAGAGVGLVSGSPHRVIYPRQARQQQRLHGSGSGSVAPLSTVVTSSPRRPLLLLLLNTNTNTNITTTTTRNYSASTPAAMPPLPPTMKAVQFSRTGGVEVLEHNDVPVPSPPAGHVLVRNRFSGVNFIDTYFRTGLYKAPALPMTLGREAAGEVVAAHASVTGPLAVPGTRVVYMASGSYAQFAAVPADRLSLVPDAVSLDLAAAALLQGLTALTLVREAAAVRPGQWTLVHAAAGGVGLLLVQMLRAVGAKVIGTASTEDKCALARKYGAEWTVNSHDDLVAKINEITGGHGVDAIFDGVGKATFEADLKMIAMKGHLVSFGNASGAVPPISVLDLAPKNIKLIRPVVNGYVQDREDLERYTTELFDMIASKKVEVLIHKVYSLADAGSAHTDIESRKTTGKLIINCE